MMPSHTATFTPDAVLSDALLMQRIAALSDKPALAELDGRHGMTLYAIAYSLLLEREAADEVVATAFREVWRSAASFDARGCTLRRWLADAAGPVPCFNSRASRASLPFPLYSSPETVDSRSPIGQRRDAGRFCFIWGDGLDRRRWRIKLLSDGAPVAQVDRAAAF